MQLPSDADRSGRNFGEEELAILRRVIESGTLNCTKGTVVKEFEKRFARSTKLNFAVPQPQERQVSTRRSLVST